MTPTPPGGSGGSRRRLGVEDHPEYPFRSGHREAVAARAREFLDAPREGAPQARLLEEFVHLSHRFSFLERLIQGRILYDLPVHVQAMSDPASSPEEEAEFLADAERDLLGCPLGPVGELAGILDEIGVKVLVLGSLAEETGSGDAVERDALEPRAARSDAADPGSLESGSYESGSSQSGAAEPDAADLFGAFYYDGRVGPALLAGVPSNRRETAFVLAHEYAHLVIDVDPYRPRFCRWEPGTLRNRVDTLEERRADRFARSLLMPREEFVRAVLQLASAVQESADASADAEGVDPRWEQLAVLFEVPRAALEARLRELDLPLPGRREPSGAEAAMRQAVGEGLRLAFPERFVNLALAAYAHRILERGHLAEFLQIPEAEAARMASWSHVEEQRKESDRAAAEREDAERGDEDEDSEGEDPEPAP